MAKKKLTLSVEDHLINTAKEKDLNISSFLEENLAEKFNLRKEIVWVSG